jgi:hypothetical protein
VKRQNWHKPWQGPLLPEPSTTLSGEKLIKFLVTYIAVFGQSEDRLITLDD